MTIGEGQSASLEVEGVWKVFGQRPDRALAMADDGRSRAEIQEVTGQTIGVRDVSFEAHKGETFVVMGLSGSGKSTLVRCVARLTDVTRGVVRLDGRDLTAMDEADLRQIRRDKMSMVFQHFGLFPHRRVIDNVGYGLEVQGLRRDERHERAERVLDLVGLEGWGDHYPQQLSGGMQQRVGLARALVVEPAVLFFDEPFSALDPLIRREMQEELLRLQASMHRTIVFVTHDFDEAIKLGDRIAIMKDGEFDQVGTAEDLITRPATDYVREFTKAVSRAKVLTASSVMDDDAVVPASRSVSRGTSVEAIIALLLADPEPIAVVGEDGERVGSVDRSAVIELI